VRTLVAASIGNAIEWYDWTIYATFALYFAGQFYPSHTPGVALIKSFATYALAFFFRPLGGWLLGRFADLRGRKTAMLLTITLMAGGSVVMGLLPGYGTVGWLAPVLLTLARVTQGISLGGEVSNASAYLAEIAPPARRGRFSAFFYISTGSAVLLASVLGTVLARTLSKAQLESFGWRIPFLVGGALALVGLWLRTTLAETEQFERNKEKAASVRRPLLVTVTEHPRAVVRMIGITMLNTLCYYTFFAALIPFAANSRHADPRDVFLASSLGTAVFIALQYPFGALSDRIGRRPQMLVWCAALAALTVPLSALVKPGLASLAVVFCVGLGAVLDVQLDRTGGDERAVPHRAARGRYRRLVQPHRGHVRRHSSSGDLRLGHGRPRHGVLLLRVGRSGDRPAGGAQPSRDDAFEAAVTGRGSLGAAP
jgi:MHS family alpha-ketoglutarate permease-like MFS transporter